MGNFAMLIMTIGIFLGLMFLFQPLRKNNFYSLHLLLVMAMAWFVESRYFPRADAAFWVAKWKIALMFVLFLHLISINIVTFLAYGYDKKAVTKNNFRIPESHLHALEFLGGWIGALLGQKIFRHKTKKSSYQSFFWAMFIVELLLIYIILKQLHFM